MNSNVSFPTQPSRIQHIESESSPEIIVISKKTISPASMLESIVNLAKGLKNKISAPRPNRTSETPNSNPLNVTTTSIKNPDNVHRVQTSPYDLSKLKSPNEVKTRILRMQKKIVEEYGDTKFTREINRQIRSLERNYAKYFKLASKNGLESPEVIRLDNERTEIIKGIRLTQKAIKAQKAASSIIDQTKIRYRLIDSGKAKMVWVIEGEDKPKYAYYTPVRSIFNRITKVKEKEMKEEVQTAKNINDALFRKQIEMLISEFQFESKDAVIEFLASFGNLKNLKDALNKEDPKEIKTFDELIIRQLKAVLKEEDLQRASDIGKHIASDLRELEGDQRIHGEYTLETTAAEGSLDKIIQTSKSDDDFYRNVQFGHQFLTAMSELHEIDMLHGDPKLDNILVYSKNDEKHIKVSDLGKTGRFNPIKKKRYKGNPRFGAPEQFSTKPSEVYSAGIVLIRILEERFLTPPSNMLVNFTKENDTLGLIDAIPPNESRRGIEKYLVMNKECPQTESSLRGKVRLLDRLIVPKTYPKVEVHTKAYIKALTDKLARFLSDEKRKELQSLLEDMTKLDPNTRPAMEIVAERYQKIWS